GDARLASWLVRKGELFGLDAARLKPPVDLLAEEARLTAKVQRVSRLAPAMLDGSGVDEQVFIRGSPRSPGAKVPRSFLEALAGTGPLKVKGSGRLELARQMTDPRKNPF